MNLLWAWDKSANALEEETQIQTAHHTNHTRVRDEYASCEHWKYIARKIRLHKFYNVLAVDQDLDIDDES